MRLGLLCILLLVPGVAASNHDADAWLETHGSLRVGVSTNTAPASFELPDGSYGGWGVDMMTLASLKTGIPVTYVPFDTLQGGVEMLQNGSIDAVGVMSNRPDLTSFATMPEPWSWTPVSLITSERHDWVEPDDAVGRISTIAGSPLEGILAQRFGHMDYVVTDNPAVGMEALADGEIDAYVAPLAIAGYQIQRLQLQGLRPVGEHLSLVETGFWAADPGAQAVLAQLRDAVSDDEAQVIYVKWTGFDLSAPQEPTTALPAWLGWAGLALLGALGVAVLFIALLRARVRAATQEIAAWNRQLEARVTEQTEEIRSQSNRLEALFAASPVGIALTTPAGDIETANPALCDLLGYAPEELVGGNLSAMDLWQDVRDRQAILGELREGRSIRSRVLALKAKDGSVRRAELSFDLVDVGGNTRILGTAMDVTEREEARRIHEAHAKALMELDAAHKMERFAADLINRTAHELSTPMTPIVLGLQTLRGALGAEHAETLERFERNVERLRTTIATAVEAARVQAADLSAGRQHVGVQEALTAAAARHEADVADAGLSLDVGGDDGTILVDRARLQLALGHLIGNAIKFTEQGSVSLHAERRLATMRILVKDTGIGLAPEALEGLWQPYAQEGDVNVAGRVGQGLGLYVTKRLMELEGGTVGVESELGQGTTFWIELPLT